MLCQDQTTLSVYNSFLQLASSFGITIVTKQQFVPNSEDFSVQIDAISTSNARIVVIFAGASDTANIILEAR